MPNHVLLNIMNYFLNSNLSTCQHLWSLMENIFENFKQSRLIEQYVSLLRGSILISNIKFSN